MPTELFVDYLPSQTPLTLGAAIVTNPAQGTIETWPVVIPVGITIPTIGISTGQLRALVDSEIIVITAGTTTAGTQTWTVTRGQEGTATATHGNGTPFFLDVTAGSAGNFVQLTPSAAQAGGISTTGEHSGADFKAIPVTGLTSGARYFAATASGAPTTGAWLANDVIIDPSGLKFWLCTVGGSPGTWSAMGGGGGGGASAATTGALGTVEVDNNSGGTPVAITAAGYLTSLTGLTTSNLSATAGILAAQLALTAAPTAGHPTVPIGTGTFTGGAAPAFQGTAALGVNMASGYANNLLDLQTAGVSQFKVDPSGIGTIRGQLIAANVSTSSFITDATSSTPYLQFSAANVLTVEMRTATQSFAVHGAAAQTADLLQHRDSGSTNQFGIANIGTGGSPIWGLRVAPTANAASMAQAHTAGANTGRAIQIIDNSGTSLGWLNLTA